MNFIVAIPLLLALGQREAKPAAPEAAPAAAAPVQAAAPVEAAAPAPAGGSPS